MRKFMTKTVFYTTIQVKSIVIENNGVTGKSLEPLTVMGNYDMNRAEKVAKKHYKGLNVVVTGVETTSKMFKLEVEKFLELATEITSEEQTQLDLSEETSE